MADKFDIKRSMKEFAELNQHLEAIGIKCDYAKMVLSDATKALTSLDSRIDSIKAVVDSARDGRTNAASKLDLESDEAENLREEAMAEGHK